MSERSTLIDRLRDDFEARTAYINSKLGVLVPSQIRSLRLTSEMPRQSDLAKAAMLHQSRISMFETPGAANVTLETLSKLAAAFHVGLLVKFVPFSEMLRWENGFSQDAFQVTRIEEDVEFLNPDRAVAAEQFSNIPANLASDVGLVTSGPGDTVTVENNKFPPSPITVEETAQPDDPRLQLTVSAMRGNLVEMEAICA